MIFFDKILPLLIGSVGWKQPTEFGAVKLDGETSASSSGLYVDGACSLVNVRSIKASHPNKDASDDEINETLKQFIKDGSANVLNYVFPSLDIFQNDLLYKYESDFNHKVDSTYQGFVGYEIQVSKRTDIAAIINQIRLTFDSDGDIDIYLFHSCSKTEVETETITVSEDDETVSVVNWVMGSIVKPGGKYYLGYQNSDSIPTGYNREFDEADKQTCFNSVSFNPIYVSGWTNSDGLFDVASIEYVSHTWGLNFDLTTCRDYSGIIKANIYKFAKAIQLAAAVEALNFIQNTTRINGEERLIKFRGENMVVNSHDVANVYFQLESEIKRLKRLFDIPLINTETLR